MIYVRTTLTVPGAGTLINVAELAETSSSHCTMVRMIELTPDGIIAGTYCEGKVTGNANEPLDTVPHPDTYHQYEGIEAEYLQPDDFEGLWAEAQAKFS